MVLDLPRVDLVPVLEEFFVEAVPLSASFSWRIPHTVDNVVSVDLFMAIAVGPVAEVEAVVFGRVGLLPALLTERILFERDIDT